MDEVIKFTMHDAQCTIMGDEEILTNGIDNNKKVSPGVKFFWTYFFYSSTLF